MRTVGYCWQMAFLVALICRNASLYCELQRSYFLMTEFLHASFKALAGAPARPMTTLRL